MSNVTPKSQRVEYTQPPDTRATWHDRPSYEPPEPFAQEKAYEPETAVVVTEDLQKSVHPPVPVTVVDMPRQPDRVKSFKAFQTDIGPGQRWALRRYDNRSMLKIMVVTADSTVYVSHEESAVSTKVGWPLVYGSDFSTTSTREIYVSNPHASAVVTVAVMYEYVTELQ